MSCFFVTLNTKKRRMINKSAQMININYTFILIVIFLFMSSYLEICNAANITLPWSTSFVGCSSDSNYPTGGWACGTSPANVAYNNVNPNVCTSNGYQQISTAANYPGGAGGRGWRRWVCGATSGNSPSTGSITLTIPSNTHEFWLRFYMRWQAGFEWNTANGLFYQKILYLRSGAISAVMDYAAGGNMRMTVQGGDGNGTGQNVYDTCSGECGWNTMNPGGEMQGNGVRLGDDSWHAVEIHYKDQTGSGTYDGVWDLWIDGTLESHVTGINWTTGAPVGLSSVQFMINQSTPSNSVPMYNDIDDIAISNTGYIGLLRSGTGNPAPSTNIY
jgi:hypothetical protein